MPKKLKSLLCLTLSLLLLTAGCTPAAAPEAGSPLPTPGTKAVQPAESALAPTPAATQTEPVPLLTVESTPDLSPYRVEAWSDQSPDGRWQVNTIVYWPPLEDTGESQPVFRVRVRIIALPDWQVIELVDEWRPYGLGLELPTVLDWESDGSALYLSDSSVPDGCGAPFYSGLRRIELPSFDIQELSLNVRGRPVLLPDGSRLAAFDEKGLSLLSLDGEETISIPVELPAADWQPGSILLSPDANQALYTLSESPCGGIASGWLGLVDLASGTSLTLLRSDERALSLLSWPVQDLAQLRNRQGEDAWLYLEQGEVRSEPPAEVAQAAAVLRGFFRELSQGNYAAAVQYFGGSYELLRDHNPSIPPDDLESLWRNACQINGAQCLPVKSLILAGNPSTGVYRFWVQFTLDGEIFSQDACCGGPIEDFPPTDEFLYTVRLDANGNNVVVDLPVYTP
jgi:hypothetical protein